MKAILNKLVYEHLNIHKEMYKSPIINLKNCIKKKMQFPLQLRMDQRKVTSFWQTPWSVEPSSDSWKDLPTPGICNLIYRILLLDSSKCQ